MQLQTLKSRVNLQRFIPLMLIGSGLIILGFVAVKIISNGKGSSDYSVIPSIVSYRAPELTLNDINGKKVTISDYHQQIVLVNNWAVWFPPCQEEMPTLLNYYKKHSNQGFLLIGIEAGDPVKDVASFVEEYHLTFPILLDPGNKSLVAFHNDSLPSSYVIDHHGIVVLAWTGPIDQAMLEKYLTPLLEQ